MFYTYHQNNSGGSYEVNSDVAWYVIIEAPDAETADALAQTKGVYFDGCESGRDCDCCGDRWYCATGAGSLEPLVYGRQLSEVNSKFSYANEPLIHVYYLNGERYTKYAK